MYRGGLAGGGTTSLNPSTSIRAGSPSGSWLQRTFGGRRGRVLREYLTGYLFIAPATFLVFLFGIFPVGFALYVSLYKWRLKRTDFIGLDNYVKAIDNLAYVGAFILGLGALAMTVIMIRRVLAKAKNNQEQPWILTLPGLLTAAAIASFLRWTVLLLPEVLDIASKIIGVEKTQALFYTLLAEAFRAESVFPAFGWTVILVIVAVVAVVIAQRYYRSDRTLEYQTQFAISWMSIGAGIFLLIYTYLEVIDAYRTSLETGGRIQIWPQIITIGTGVLLLIAAWFVWRSAEAQSTSRAFWFRVMATMVLLVGGWLLIGEIPAVLAAGDEDMWQGLRVTIFYSLGTVPFQLGISLFLAVLLFQQLSGSELFRMLYFLPYVTPFVASAAVFRQMFSIRPQAPVNQLVKLLGGESLRWIQEPIGIFTLLGERLGVEIPTWASGPSLALVVVILFSIWVYVGYDTVIYMAGLGNISTELIDAAEIDGAGRWQIFRYVIFPLLSPTTYFLSLIAIIGTFKAFSSIWVMRHELALGTVDTFSVMIFNEFFTKLQYGYASALAFVLFAIILCLTLINNRIQGSRVFYG
jgi:multiple sugar transport system permease protein